MVPERSLSSSTISEDIKSGSASYLVQDCSDEDCAFGWETYVVDHNCKASESKWSRISIHKLLHQEENNPLSAKYVSGTIRHVHLPANNMTWVQVS